MKRVNSGYLGAHGPILGGSVQGSNTAEPVSKRASQELGLINTFPEEMILTVFEHCKTSLPALASVNRLWKQITGKKEFYAAMFSPAFASLCFGKADLKTHFEMDLGPDEVPHLHLADYGNLEKGICLLTYFPKEIPIEGKDGVISWVPPNAKIIGELVKKPKCGYATSFDPDSCFHSINKKREIKGGEWVVTYKKPIGHGKTFDIQVLSAEKQGEDTDVAELEKTIYAVFMHYVKTGERCFPRDMAKGDYSLISFKEQIYGHRLVCGFSPSGLIVYSYYHYDNNSTSVAVARKSIDPCILGTKTHLTQEG